MEENGVKPDNRTDRLGAVGQIVPFYYGDEINITEVFVVLIKWKRVVWACILVFLLGGVGAALIPPREYRHFTTLEIGSRVVWHEGQLETVPIDNPLSVATTVEEGIAPIVVQSRLEKNPEGSGSVKIKAEAPKDGRVLIIETQGTTAESDTLLELLRETAEQVRTLHQEASRPARQNYERELAKARARLAEIPSESGTEIGALEERIKSLESGLYGMQETRSLSVPTREIRPCAPRRKLIVVLSSALGILVGVSAAFFLEYIERARRELRSLQASSEEP